MKNPKPNPFFKKFKIACFLFAIISILSCNNISQETKDEAQVFHEILYSNSLQISKDLISLFDRTNGLSGNIFQVIDTAKSRKLAQDFAQTDSIISQEIDRIRMINEFDSTILYKEAILKGLINYQKLLHVEFTILLTRTTRDVSPDYVDSLNQSQLNAMKKFITIESEIVNVQQQFCEKYSVSDDKAGLVLMALKEGLNNLEYKIESLKKINQM